LGKNRNCAESESEDDKPETKNTSSRFSVKREYAPTTSHAGTTYFTLTKRPSLYRIVLLDNSKKVFCDDKKDVYFNSPKIGFIDIYFYYR
jgi:hypothetical protein